MSAKPSKLLPFIVLVFIGLKWVGCKDNLQSLSENDKYAYSMSGSLDLHADTQWVRIMPIGETLISTSSVPNNVEVTLNREVTNEITVLKDSLFTFGGDARVWNYWTTEPLHSNERYTIRVEGSEGTSSATVMMPSPLPLPVVATNSEDNKGIIRGSSSEPLVTADTKFFIRKIELGSLSSIIEITFSHLDNVNRYLNGEYNFRYDIDEIILQEAGISPNGYVMVRKELIVATGSKDWPDYSVLSDREAVLPGKVSNVENGTGFVAGIASRKIPLESCYDDEDNLVPCSEVGSEFSRKGD